MKRCEWAKGTVVHCEKLAAVTVHDADVGDRLTRSTDLCGHHAEWLMAQNDGTQFADLERARVESWLWNVEVAEAESAELEGLEWD